MDLKVQNQAMLSALKALGARVRIKHNRRWGNVWVSATETTKVREHQRQLTGGSTVVTVELNGEIIVGQANCLSTDKFVKAVGVNTALSKVMSAIKEVTNG
jgi:hypothetical protein